MYCHLFGLDWIHRYWKYCVTITTKTNLLKVSMQDFVTMSDQSSALKFGEKDVNPNCQNREIIKYLNLREVKRWADLQRYASYATMKSWIASFQRGAFSIGDKNRSRNPFSVSSFVNVDAVEEMIWRDRRIELKQISEVLDISYICVHHKVYVDLDMRKLFAKCIPKYPDARVEVSLSFCARFEKDASHAVTMDET